MGRYNGPQYRDGSSGAKICLDCPVQIRETTGHRGQRSTWPCSQADKPACDIVTEPVCLYAYVLYKFQGKLSGQGWQTEVLSRADRLTHLLDPMRPSSADDFRRAIDDLAAPFDRAAAALEPYHNGKTGQVIREIAAATLGQGLSQAAFDRAVTVYADRARFLAEVER